MSTLQQTFRFTRNERVAFGRLLSKRRKELGLSQLEVARRAFQYQISHCKVSRVERAVMRMVDPFAIQRIAEVLGIEMKALKNVDPQFEERLALAETANQFGFWNMKAKAIPA